jgi:hypothetical protein
MITERLKAAIAKAEELPQEAQDALAAQIESAISNARWDALLADPRYDAILEEMIAQADTEEPLPFPKPQGAITD